MNKKMVYVLGVTSTIFLVQLLQLGVNAQDDSLRCFDHHQAPVLGTAMDACFSNPGIILNKMQVQFDNHPTNLGSVVFWGNLFSSNVADYTLHSPMPMIKMIQSQINNAFSLPEYPSTDFSTTNFICDGIIQIGCIDVFEMFDNTGDYRTWTCNKNMFISPPFNGDQNANYNNGVTTAPNKRFIKECRCEHSPAACSFKQYSSGCKRGGAIPGVGCSVANEGTPELTVRSATNQAAAYLEVKQDTGLRKVLNISMEFQNGLTISNLLEVVVCGLERVTCNGACAPWVLEWPCTQVSAYCEAASNIDSWFTHATPSTAGTNNYGWDASDLIPNGWTYCTMKTSGLYTSCLATTPFSHARISYDTTAPPSTLKFYPLVVDNTVAFSRQTFFIVGETKGGVKGCREIQVEVCGSETITSTHLPTPVPRYSYTYNQGGGLAGPVMPDVTTIWSVDSTYCLPDMSTVEIVYQSSPGVYTTSAQAYISSNRVYIRTNLPTTPYLQTHYIRVSNPTSGQSGLCPFEIQVCGAETVTVNPPFTPSLPPYFFLYGQGADVNGFSTDATDVRTYFTVSNPSCPLATYEIHQETSPGVFAVYSTFNQGTSSEIYIDASYKLKTHVWTPKDLSNLYIAAITQQGGVAGTARLPFTTKVCGNEALTSTGAQNKFVFQKGFGVRAIGLTAYQTSNDARCPVSTYSVIQNDGSAFVPSSLTTDLAGTTQLMVNTSTPQMWVLRLTTTTVTNHPSAPAKVIQANDVIYITVCGGEVLSTIITAGGLPDPQFQYLQGSGDQLPFYQPPLNALSQWFTNSNGVDCPIVVYELFSSLSGGYGGSDMALEGTGVNQNVAVYTRRNWRGWYYVRAKTGSQATAFLRFWVQVCGYESVYSAGPQKYIYKLNEGTGSRMMESFQDLIYSTDKELCDVTAWSITKYDPLTASWRPNDYGLLVESFLTFNFTVYTSASKHGLYRITATTNGTRSGVLQLEVEICGREHVTQVPGQPRVLNLRFMQFSGNGNIKLVRWFNIFSLVASSSRNCPIEKKLSYLTYEIWDLLLKRPISMELWKNETVVRYNNRSFELEVNTTEPMELQLFLAVKTETSGVYFLPVNITVYKREFIVWNRKPTFQQPEGYQLNYHVSEAKFPYMIWLNVTEMSDDHRKLMYLNFTSHVLGDLRYRFDLDKQKPTLHKRIKDFMFYDEASHSLGIKFEGGPEGILNYCNVIYRIKVVIEDHLGLWSAKTLQLNLTMNDTFYQWWLRRNDVVPEPIQQCMVPLGRATRISVFGEVDIKINATSGWRPKKISEDWRRAVGPEAATLYIKPANNWHIWTEQRPESTNFTWELREFSETKLRIKLNFSNPLSISPDLEYDKLQIFIPDLTALFEPSSSNGRSLAITSYQALITKPVPKQMLEDPRGRRLLQDLYDFRYAMSYLFVLFFCLGVMFRQPFDRMLKMLLELQIMVNLPMMRVTMPANALIGMQIFKPFVDLTFRKEFNHRFPGYEELRLESEQLLDNFGQRSTFGLDTYNIWLNIGTMGHLLVFWSGYTIMIYLLLQLALWLNARRRFIDHYRGMFEKLMYNDLLLILICSMLEFGEAVLMSMVDFNFQTNSVMNILVAVGALIIFVYVLPYLIFRQQATSRRNRKLRDKNRLRFGQTLLGFRPNFVGPNNVNLVFLVWYIGIRYSFLAIVFFVPIGWLQLWLMIALIQASITVLGSEMPLQGRWSNLLLLFNLSSVMVCLYHMLVFSDFGAQSREAQYEMGYSLLICILVFIIFNLLFALMDFVRAVLLMIELYLGDLIRKCWRWWLHHVWNPLVAYLKELYRKLKNLWEYLKIKLNCYRLLMDFLRRYFGGKKEIKKPKQEIVPDAEPIIERPPTPPPPPTPPRPVTPPKPPSPKVATLQLIQGKWTTVMKSAAMLDAQNKDSALPSKNYLNHNLKLRSQLLGMVNQKKQAQEKGREQARAILHDWIKRKNETGEPEAHPLQSSRGLKKVQYKQVNGIWQKVEEPQMEQSTQRSQPNTDWQAAAAKNLAAGKDQGAKEAIGPEPAELSDPIANQALPVKETSRTSSRESSRSRAKASAKITAAPTMDVIKEEPEQETQEAEVTLAPVDGSRPKRTRKWSLFLPTGNPTPAEEQAAKYHDPALYLPDQGKDQSAVEVHFTDAHGQHVKRVVEKNPHDFSAPSKKLFEALTSQVRQNLENQTSQPQEMNNQEVDVTAEPKVSKDVVEKEIELKENQTESKKD